MYRMLVLFLISFIGYISAAQSISLSGKVTNKSGKPIAGAIVTLAGQKLKDTTEAGGSYSLVSGTFVTVPSSIFPGVEKISLTNGMVMLSLTKPAAVSISMFDMKGNELEKVLEHPASAGEYRFDLMTYLLAAKVIIVRVSIGQRASTFRYVPIGKSKGSVASSSVLSSRGREGLAKTQAFVDSLKVSAIGYLSNITAISSYQGVVNIMLDTLALGKFSFFVTSLKGLQELSGGQDGFGGDLRFGKTGQGAGLLGADSICQCLAEKSMPGSKVKIWRAFLSVAKDASGKQVNAIDRIGTGPWYDRLGRLVSNTISDLLHERPNADAVIKNDLPNEDGVPNHRPDPNSAQVDNHQFITGSDTLGRLHSSTSTCKDWTSTSADSGGKPACGLSWPQSFGGGRDTVNTGRMMPRSNKHWIFVWDLFGCEAGIDLNASTGKGKPGIYTIGNGGGYGGFYCFALNP